MEQIARHQLYHDLTDCYLLLDKSKDDLDAIKQRVETKLKDLDRQYKIKGEEHGIR